MENFIKQNFDISYVARARKLPTSSKKSIDVVRPHNVLIFMNGCEKHYALKNGKTLHAANNDIVFLPAGSEYTVFQIKPGETYSLNFDLGSSAELSPFVFHPKNATAFSESFKKASKAWGKKYTGYEMRLKSETYNVICNIIKEYELEYISKSSNSRLSPALDYIQKEYTKDNIPVSLLAELCGMSEVTFRSIFTNSMGITPIKYINNLKLELAKELLSSSDRSITEIAELSGFHDECYFSREFKKHAGISPSEFRKQSKFDEYE